MKAILETNGSIHPIADCDPVDRYRLHSIVIHRTPAAGCQAPSTDKLDKSDFPPSGYEYLNEYVTMFPLPSFHWAIH